MGLRQGSQGGCWDGERQRCGRHTCLVSHGVRARHAGGLGPHRRFGGVVGLARSRRDGCVGFLSELSRGAWATMNTSDPTPSVALGGAPVLVVMKVALTGSIHKVVVAQGAANDVETADPAWSQGVRRFSLAVELLTLDKDPDIARDARRVQKVLCDDGSRAVTRRSADEKVAFGRNLVAVAASPDVAVVVERLGLGDKTDDIRECTDDLDDAVRSTGGAGERRPRSKRITRASSACAAVFNWVHEGLTLMIESARDPGQREELQGLLAPFENLLLQRASEAPAAESDETESEPEAKPLAPTG